MTKIPSQAFSRLGDSAASHWPNGLQKRRVFLCWMPPFSLQSWILVQLWVVPSWMAQMLFPLLVQHSLLVVRWRFTEKGRKRQGTWRGCVLQGAGMGSCGLSRAQAEQSCPSPWCILPQLPLPPAFIIFKNHRLLGTFSLWDHND